MESRPARRRPRRIDVALTPALLQEPERTVCIVVDVLRLTSSVVTMFGRGLSAALIVATPAQARRAAKQRPRFLLCGEEGGLPPRGFDYGNSPREFDALDLRGRRAVLATTNGTRALVRAAECPVVLAGALLNVTAVAREAKRLATSRQLDITVACAGQEQGRALSLEDSFAAGAIVDALGRGGELSDAARVALAIYQSYRGSGGAVFRDAVHATALEVLGLRRDLTFCAQRDRFRVTPRLRRAADGSLWLRAK